MKEVRNNKGSNNIKKKLLEILIILFKRLLFSKVPKIIKFSTLVFRIIIISNISILLLLSKRRFLVKIIIFKKKI